MLSITNKSLSIPYRIHERSYQYSTIHFSSIMSAHGVFNLSVNTVLAYTMLPAVITIIKTTGNLNTPASEICTQIEGEFSDEYEFFVRAHR